jgi:hypothetical protein
MRIFAEQPRKRLSRFPQEIKTSIGPINDESTKNPKASSISATSKKYGMRSAKWKYLRVRRLLLYLEESIDRGSQWAVFEPNVRA